MMHFKNEIRLLWVDFEAVEEPRGLKANSRLYHVICDPRENVKNYQKGK